MDPIRRIESLDDFPEDLRGCVVAIGNFDGLHRGHQAVLQVALDEAQRRSVPAVMLTFEPHPRTLFKPDAPVFRLTPAPLKARLAGIMGFACVVELPFTHEIAQMSADSFVGDVLVGALGICHVVTGFNFHFGKARQGSPEFLTDAGTRFGFDVTVVEPFADENTELVSSSRIRACLAAGDVSQANGLLGYRYTVEAPVVKGKQLGRTLGFPTANMALPQEAELCTGIYAVRFTRADGAIHDGVASFGYRPTVDENGVPLLETFLFNFEGDLYNENCAVSFFAHLRDEEKFDGLDLLTKQMRRDSEAAGAVLGDVRPLGPMDRMLAFG
ncbi:bifunctional riboflavin kinase/FAD synthetase [Hoeflea prorocentri]|uniref:Riboflavin biosynthesis protein n=1 Tax=Hoeflea prorocentri TaxID=1922333 RepID=A0A9X3UKU9_9HYPH|nr:bifunctional riboflavin kinase/FAD synthetase [Hoeflea prorocentri]MCY6382265.1 bifunctional riboflavin kinase/FAD synthetase [Hoeflea prorocentri]MDA5400065.1 bifunctional riboflavin kinase/FAD synthetase [Hoeflea prorocentri]